MNKIFKNKSVKPEKMNWAKLKGAVAAIASLCIVCSFFIAMVFSGCKKNENSVSEPKEVELGSLQKILDGYTVISIAFDSKGNAWIGTLGQGIIRYNTKETVFYNSENSIISKDFIAWDIAVDKNDHVWIDGSGESGGLLKYDGKGFTLYNSKNTAMPLDNVKNVAVDSKNNVWFFCGNYNTGGLVKYDGTEWTVYTPDNSILPYNILNSITIDRSDNVWVAYHNQLIKISNNVWKVYSYKELGFTPYHIGDIKINSKNCVVGAIDYYYSSAVDHSSSPSAFVFDEKNSASLFSGPLHGFEKVFVDHKDNIWFFGILSDFALLIDKQWKQINFVNSVRRINSINEDADHRIWFGTGDGIYISDKNPLNR